MSMSCNWHPAGGAYNAEAKQRNGTIWVKISQFAGVEVQEIALFFDSVAHSRAVAAAFNQSRKPEAPSDDL